jgi:hypothetical protein
MSRHSGRPDKDDLSSLDFPFRTRRGVVRKLPPHRGKGTKKRCSPTVLPEFDAREEARAKVKQEVLAPFIEQAMMGKEKVAQLADDKIPSFVALGRQVAVNAPQLTPEQEAARGCWPRHTYRSKIRRRRQQHPVDHPHDP